MLTELERKGLNEAKHYGSQGAILAPFPQTHVLMYSLTHSHISMNLGLPVSPSSSDLSPLK